MHMNLGYFLVVSEIIKQRIELARAVALCIHMNKDNFLIISEIIKQET